MFNNVNFTNCVLSLRAFSDVRSAAFAIKNYDAKNLASKKNLVAVSLALVALADIAQQYASFYEKSLPAHFALANIAVRALAIGAIYTAHRGAFAWQQIAVLAQLLLPFTRIPALPLAQVSNALIGAEMTFRFAPRAVFVSEVPGPRRVV